MTNIYLKMVDGQDYNLYKEFYTDIKKHFKGAKNNINIDSFNSWYNSFKDALNSENSIHAYPFWMIEDNKVIGLPIIKTNIEISNEYKNYGGNISYVIAPSYRGMGYGTICCHLAIEKCHEYGLNEVMISCEDKNIGSSKIIENNFGILKDVCIYNGDNVLDRGKLYRRYIINVSESLKKFNDNSPTRKTTIQEICNINRSNIADFLINNTNNVVGDDMLLFSSKFNDISTLDDLSILHQEFMKIIHIDNTNIIDCFSRTTEEIINSNIYTSNNDIVSVMSVLLRLKNVPTILVCAHNIDDIKSFTDVQSIKNHYFLEIYFADKWYLYDVVSGKIYDNYDYSNLSLPNRYHVFRKGLSNFNFGFFSQDDYNYVFTRRLDDFKGCYYKEPEYDIIDLNNHS